MRPSLWLTVFLTLVLPARADEKPAPKALAITHVTVIDCTAKRRRRT